MFVDVTKLKNPVAIGFMFTNKIGWCEDAPAKAQYTPNDDELEQWHSRYHNWCTKFNQEVDKDIAAALATEQELELARKQEIKDSYNNNPMIFTSSLGFTVNGDDAAWCNVAGILKFEDEWPVQFRTGDNEMVALSKDELELVQKEMFKFRRDLLHSKWQQLGTPTGA